MQLNLEAGRNPVFQVGSQKSPNMMDREEPPFKHNSGLNVKFLITNTPWKTPPLYLVQQIFLGA